MNTVLIGQAVKIRSNNFIQSDWAAYVKIINSEDKNLLLELNPPVVNGDAIYEYAIIAPRLARDTIDTLFNAKVLGCAVTWIPVKQFNPQKPLDLSWWRGGAAAITDVIIE